MEGNVAPLALSEPTLEILAADRQTTPLVLASPHSGTNYPPDLIAASRLDPLNLRRSEDSYVDEIFGAGPDLGAPMLKARFARAYLDPNREPFELDPTMFEDALPDFVNRHSPRVRVGLGTIARVVASGEEIYARKLRFAEALHRIEQLYRPLTKSDQETLKRLTRQLRTGGGTSIGQRTELAPEIHTDKAAAEFLVELSWVDGSGTRRRAQPLFRAEFERQDAAWPLTACRIVGPSGL